MNDASSAPRIGVVGSCQVVGMGATFQKMWPNAEVKTWHMKPNCPDSPESIAEQLAQCDLAVSQVRAPHTAPLAITRLRETSARAIFVPVVVFNGFHPDCIYLKVNDTPIAGPFQLLHSGIIAGGYALGLPEARVARLFNALTYASVGYFDAFGIARDLMTASFAASGYDLSKLVDHWMANVGAFMYTGNHPRICVLSALAHMAAVRAGMADADSSAPEDVNDFLAHSYLWPIYPELARKFAFPKGDLAVQLASRTVERHPLHIRKLPEVISTFYKIYAEQDRAGFRAAVPPRILAGLSEMLSE